MPTSWNGVNIIMSNGVVSNLSKDAKNHHNGDGWKEVKINPVGSIVKRIVMRGSSDTEFSGV